MADMGGEPKPGPNPLDPFKLTDKLFDAKKKSWWNTLDSNKQTAWAVLAGAAAVGVLGVPLVSVIAEGAKIPAAKNIAACAWLLAITLPTAGVVAVLSALMAPPPKLHTGYHILFVAAIAGLAGVFVMNAIIEGAGGALADFYCYNDGTIHETACRAFNTQGLATTPLGSPNQNANFLANLFVLTVDARGYVMVLCGIAAGGSVGYLGRRASDGT